MLNVWRRTIWNPRRLPGPGAARTSGPRAVDPLARRRQSPPHGWTVAAGYRAIATGGSRKSSGLEVIVFVADPNDLALRVIQTGLDRLGQAQPHGMANQRKSADSGPPGRERLRPCCRASRRPECHSSKRSASSGSSSRISVTPGSRVCCALWTGSNTQSAVFKLAPSTPDVAREKTIGGPAVRRLLRSFPGKSPGSRRQLPAIDRTAVGSNSRQANRNTAYAPFIDSHQRRVEGREVFPRGDL